MNKLLVAAGALLASALLVPGDASAQRGFRAGGFGGGVRAGGFGGGFRGSGGFGGGFRGSGAMFRPGFGAGGIRGGGAMFRPGFGTGSFRAGTLGVRPGLTTGSIGVRPGLGLGGVRGVAIARPGVGGFYRPGLRGYRGVYGRGWRYPYYGFYRRGWRYPYYGWYGGALAAGLALGYPYSYGYPDDYGYYDNPYSDVVYAPSCYWVRRRVVGPHGHVVIRRIQVCGY